MQAGRTEPRRRERKHATPAMAQEAFDDEDQVHPAAHRMGYDAMRWEQSPPPSRCSRQVNSTVQADDDRIAGRPSAKREYLEKWRCAAGRQLLLFFGFGLAVEPLSRLTQLTTAVMQ